VKKIKRYDVFVTGCTYARN